MKSKLLLALSLACLLMAGTIQKAASQNPSDGLELHLPLDENTRDASGFNRHGILEGAKLTTDRFGKQNSAYAFDSGANVNIANFSSVGFKGVTMSTWIKTSKTNPQQQVIQGMVGVMYINWIKTGHFMTAFDGTAGNNKSGEISKTYVADGKWHHIAATNDGSITRLYVDGALETSYYESLTTGTRDIQIGGGAWYFTGSIDDIRIYSQALPAIDIKAIHNGSITGIEDKSALNQALNIYPNPANGKSNIQVEIADDIRNGNLIITTLTGQQVYNQALNNISAGNIVPIDIKHFSRGLYMVNVVSDKGTSRTKLVLQ